MPASKRYSKPILMLIDQLDFSGADFLPAILRDNERVTLFGARTAGAGGCVNTYTYPNRFGLSQYSLTTTFALRSSGACMENLGVTPDIVYQVTPLDLQNGYHDYASAVNKALGAIMLHL